MAAELTSRARGVGRERAPALDRVVDDRLRVARLPRRGELRERDVRELRDPAAHVLAVRVVALLLEHRVVEAAVSGAGSTPTEEIHCQLPLLLATSPSSRAA